MHMIVLMLKMAYETIKVWNADMHACFGAGM
jgi:hypothetical protein